MTVHEDLVIDVGMSTGIDTKNYLAAGYRVVAVEGNPAAVQAATAKFAKAIDRGQLFIVPYVIADREGMSPFHVSDERPWVSTATPSVVRWQVFKAAREVNYRTIYVPAVPFRAVLEGVGIPYYLKVDIEGADMLCIQALRGFTERPKYLSMESSLHTGPLKNVLNEVRELHRLGYRRFAYVNQRKLNRNLLPEYFGSGPFGTALQARWVGITTVLVMSVALRLHHILSWSKVATPYRRLVRMFDVGYEFDNWWDLHAGQK